MDTKRTLLVSLIMIAFLMAATPSAQAAPPSEVVDSVTQKVWDQFGPQPITCYSEGSLGWVCQLLNHGSVAHVCESNEGWLVEHGQCDRI